MPIDNGPGAQEAHGAGGGIAGQRSDSHSTAGASSPPSSAPELRPYQRDVIARISAEIAEGRRKVLLVAPTAAGKTVIAGAIVRAAADRGDRVLFLDHRRELTAQTSRRFYDAGIDAGIIQAGFPARPGEPVQIASVATLHARLVRSRTIERPPADLVIIDEAHHVRARMYRMILERYPGAVLIGMTATPCRGDGRGLGNVFDVLVECPSVAELTAATWLVPALVYAPVRPDLSGLRVARGDYVESELATRVDTRNLVGDIVEHWHRLAERRRTIVFAAGVRHSVHIRDEFRRSGVVAEHIDGSTPTDERDSILERLCEGSVDLITNAMVLVEGWDQPAVAALVLARPTKSLGVYRQMVGRVLRPSPGKTDAIILDHAGAVYQHGLPDEPIKWALAADRRAENTAQAARGRHQAPALTTCPECTAVRFEGQPCPVCGWRPVAKPLAVEIADGELGMVRRGRGADPAGRSPEERRRFHRQLVFIAHEHGYRPGWAAHKYREKFEVGRLTARQARSRPILRYGPGCARDKSPLPRRWRNPGRDEHDRARCGPVAGDFAPSRGRDQISRQ